MSLETGKILAGVGAILAGVGMFGYAIPAIVGLILFLVGMIELADALNEPGIKENTVKWFIFSLLALIVLAIGILVGLLSMIPIPPFNMYRQAGPFHAPYVPYMIHSVWVLAWIAIFLVVAAVLFILSARYLSNAMDGLARRTGEGLFRVGGRLYFIGAVLTIIVIGVILIPIAFIIIGIALLVVKIS